MSFDYREYAEAMDEFLLQMEQIPSHVHPDIAKALRRLCVLLRISKVEACLYGSVEEQSLNHGGCVCFYQSGEEVDESRAVVHSETAENGNVTTYRFVPVAGSEAWSELEQDKIRLVSKMLFVYNGRTRALQFVEELVFLDPQLKIHNYAYFMKTCGMLIKAGSIGQYGAGYFNLKRFSNVNQQLGRDDATEVMLAFIKGLQKKLTEEECICRVGGDNFVILFKRDNFEIVLQYLKGQGMVYDEESGGKVFIGTTAGYCLISENTGDAEEIMDNISIAFNQAKNITTQP